MKIDFGFVNLWKTKKFFTFVLFPSIEIHSDIRHSGMFVESTGFVTYRLISFHVSWIVFMLDFYFYYDRTEVAGNECDCCETTNTV